MNIGNFIDSFVIWITGFQRKDVIALIVLILAFSFAISTVKTALKVSLSVLAFLAVLYLVAPELYDYCIFVIVEFIESLKEILGRRFLLVLRGE